MINDVAIEAGAPAAQHEAVDEIFRRAGFGVKSRAVIRRRSADVLPWVVHVTLAASIAAFFAAFGAEAGKDAYAAVKAWSKEMFEARKSSGLGFGEIWLQDPNGTDVILASEWPDTAFDALADVDWDHVEGSYFVWEERDGRWKDGLSEEREAPSS